MSTTIHRWIKRLITVIEENNKQCSLKNKASNDSFDLFVAICDKGNINNRINKD